MKKCKDCNCAKRGWFDRLPEAYVCIGVKEPFVIDDYPNAVCTTGYCNTEKVDPTIDDGVYIEFFAIKNGVRYNAKIIPLEKASVVLTNSLMDGIQKLCE